MKTIKIKTLNKNAILPTLGSKYAAGYDLYACLDEDVSIYPHETAKIPTGIAIEIPTGYFCGIYARSGLATKQGLRPANCVGICDSDYRGEYIVALYNDSDLVRTVKAGDRIAQLIIQKYLSSEFILSEELSDTDRGCGGFGSSGE